MSYPHYSTDCGELHDLVRDFGGKPSPRPTIVCLCGSTRFYREYAQANYEETMKGKIVLSVGFFGHARSDAHSQTVGITPAQKGYLDELHKRKIELADEVLVIDVDGYIGESTSNEIAHARSLAKPVRYWESERSDPSGRTAFGSLVPR